MLNVFSALKATPEQSHDMLTFYQVGMQAFKQYIACYILPNPTSTNGPLRRHKVLTMATVKPTKTKAKQKEKEAKQVIIANDQLGAIIQNYHMTIHWSNTPVYHVP